MAARQGTEGFLATADGAAALLRRLLLRRRHLLQLLRALLHLLLVHLACLSAYAVGWQTPSQSRRHKLRRCLLKIRRG